MTLKRSHIITGSGVIAALLCCAFSFVILRKQKTDALPFTERQTRTPSPQFEAVRYWTIEGQQTTDKWSFIGYSDTGLAVLAQYGRRPIGVEPTRLSIDDISHLQTFYAYATTNGSFTQEGFNLFGAESSFYFKVRSMWLTGDKDGVLTIAKDRLRHDENDLAGLLLKAEYQGEFLQLLESSNTLRRVINIGTQYKGTNFAEYLSLLEFDMEVLGYFITNYPPDEYEKDKAKAYLAGKIMTCDGMLLALEKDGYFGNDCKKSGPTDGNK